MVTVRSTVAGAPGETVTVVELRVKVGALLPPGARLALSVMVPVNPLVLLMVMVVVAEPPCLTVRLDGLADIEKSGGSLLAHWTLVSSEVSVTVAFDVATVAPVVLTTNDAVVIVALVLAAVELDGPVNGQPSPMFPLESSLTIEEPAEAMDEPPATNPPSEVWCTEADAIEGPPFSQTIFPIESSLKTQAPPGEPVDPTTMYPPSEVWSTELA